MKKRSRHSYYYSLSKASNITNLPLVSPMYVLGHVVGGERGRRGRCELAREQFRSLAPDPCGSSHRHAAFAPTHAELFCAGHHHDCRQVDPRRWTGGGSLRARAVANEAFGSQKEEHQVQGSCGSGGSLMKKPTSERWTYRGNPTTR